MGVEERRESRGGGGLKDLINVSIGYEDLFCRRAAPTFTNFFIIIIIPLDQISFGLSVTRSVLVLFRRRDRFLMNLEVASCLFKQHTRLTALL